MHWAAMTTPPIQYNTIQYNTISPYYYFLKCDITKFRITSSPLVTQCHTSSTPSAPLNVWRNLLMSPSKTLFLRTWFWLSRSLLECYCPKWLTVRIASHCVLLTEVYGSVIRSCEAWPRWCLVITLTHHSEQKCSIPRCQYCSRVPMPIIRGH